MDSKPRQTRTQNPSPANPTPQSLALLPSLGPPHNSHIETRLPFTVHAVLLNRRFRLTVKAHDDGEDGECVW